MNAEPKLDIATLNAMSAEAFAATLGDIYEHAPWVAAAAAARRPFATPAALEAAMSAIVRAAGIERQTTLLRSHPELGESHALAPESAREQRERGLDRLDRAQSRHLAALNAAYRARFGFPFIVAVRGQKDMTAIVAALERRMAAPPDAERDTALDEVVKIAGFRLARRIA